MKINGSLKNVHIFHKKDNIFVLDLKKEGKTDPGPNPRHDERFYGKTALKKYLEQLLCFKMLTFESAFFTDKRVKSFRIYLVK